MTEGQLRRARKLIRRLCANYDEGNCLALDEGEGCVCVQSHFLLPSPARVF